MIVRIMNLDSIKTSKYLNFQSPKFKLHIRFRSNIRKLATLKTISFYYVFNFTLSVINI